MVRPVLALLLATCACKSSDPEPEMFAYEPPIEGADPSRRHPEAFRLPTALRVERRVDQRSLSCIAYGIDETRLEPVTLEVGHKMVVGMYVLWTVPRGKGINRELTGLASDGGVGGVSTAFWHGPDGKGAPPGGEITAEIEVFETDIPPQHHWSPTGGQYRVLWRRTLSAPVPD